MFRIFPAGTEVRAPDRHFDRRRSPKAHDLADDICGLERHNGSWRQGWQLPSEPLLQVLGGYTTVRLQGHPQHGFVWAARPQQDGVDRVARRLNADVADRALHIACSSLLA